MTKQDWQGKVALITGASSGIGAATARRLAREGLRVVLVARRVDRLQQLTEEIRQIGGQAEILPADLSLTEERARVFADISGRYGGVDVLFNNAGAGWYGYLAEMPWPLAREVLEVDVMAVVQLTALFLPGMRACGRGHIINMGSIIGGFPMQGTAIYAGSKAFLDAFTTALHRELAGTPVHASVVRAGPVKTEFFAVTTARPNGHKLPGEIAAVPAEQIAAAVWSLLRRPRRVVYVPGYLGLTPWVEMLFGWVIDRVGPVLLKRSMRSMRSS